ncbi:MAG: hypothetical protein ABI905_05620 [Betaproteobacteria bacterium]
MARLPRLPRLPPSPPGSALWLLRHELRLAWRSMGGKRLWLLISAVIVLWCFLHFASWLLMSFVASHGVDKLPPMSIIAAGFVFWLFASIMVSQTVAHAVAALFDRGDLDLLLSSPLSARLVLAMRGLGIAVGACFLPALLLLPVAHAAVVVGLPGFLGIYAVIASLGLFAAAVGMALTMTLVRIFGARRAKTIAQISAAIIGAAFFLVMQAQNILPRERREAFTRWLRDETRPDGMLSGDSVMWWPVKAMMGELLPLLLVILVGAGGFWFVVNLAYRRFVSGTQEAMSGGGTRKVATAGPYRFRSGLMNVLLTKEWKLLLRDPQIISQTLLQVFYLLPLMLLGFRGDRNAWMIIPGFVVISAMLAGNLAWLTLAAEDAPDLVGTAPVSLNRIRWIKALAAVLPVLAMLAPLVLWWLGRDPAAAMILLVCCSGGMFSAAVCHIWNPRTGNRRDMKQRYKESKLTSVLESMGSFGWAGMAYCLNGHWIWIPVALFFIVAGPGSAWVFGRSARREGGLA